MLFRSRVTDNGPGVPPDFQELLFEKFARAEDSQRKVAGTGIGLAFCRMVANAHKGSIEYQRAEPRGSTFALRLPSVEAATAPSGI